MGNLIDSITTAVGIGVLGIFAYKVLLPQMIELSKTMPPTLFPPMQPQVAPAPLPPISEPPVQDIIDDVMDDEDEPSSSPPPPPPVARKPAAGTPTTPSPSPPAAATGQAIGGMTIGFKTTGQKIVLTGNTHENGYRYHINHKFTHYLMSGLFKLGSGQSLIEMKTDGPNHSGCSQVPRCFWAEPRLDMSGKPSLSMEMPHTPRKDYGISCPTCKSVPGSYAGKWIGYAVAAYGPKGGRIVEQWFDPTGTGSKWQLTLREKIDARWHGAQNRDLPLDGRGLEAEIRMVNSPSGVDMKNGFVYEIVPPTGGTAGFAQALFSILEAKTPRRYNRRRWEY